MKFKPHNTKLTSQFQQLSGNFSRPRRIKHKKSDIMPYCGSRPRGSRIADCGLMGLWSVGEQVVSTVLFEAAARRVVQTDASTALGMTEHGRRFAGLEIGASLRSSQ